MSTPHYRIIRDARWLAPFIRSHRAIGRLLADYRFVACGREFIIPAGYEWDGASIPPCLWGPPLYFLPWGTYTEASLIHDFLCDLGTGGSEWLHGALWDQYPEPLSHDQAHREFYLRCLMGGTNYRRAGRMYWAIKTFGPRWK